MAKRLKTITAGRLVVVGCYTIPTPRSTGQERRALREISSAAQMEINAKRSWQKLELLLAAKEAGYEAAVCFVVQMGEVRWMEPNDRTHPEFGEALRRAARAGVQVLALDCDVRPDRLDIAGPVEVRL